MKEDQAIAAIRRVRHDISERFEHNGAALIAHYIGLQQEKYSDRILCSDRTRPAHNQLMESNAEYRVAHE